MRVYHLWTTIELEDTDDDYFEELDVPVSIGHFRTFDEATKYQLKLQTNEGWDTDLIHDGEKSDD